MGGLSHNHMTHAVRPQGAAGGTAHSQRQTEVRMVLLMLVVGLLALLGPLVVRSTHIGTSNFYAVLVMLGGFVALAAGSAMMAHFYAMGDRFHLFVGLAFLVNGACDIGAGAVEFVGRHTPAMPLEQSMQAFLPGTHAAGRLFMGLLLLTACTVAPRWPESRRPHLETVLWSAAAFATGLLVAVFIYFLPIRTLIHEASPGAGAFGMLTFFISRPLDFIGGLVFVAVLFDLLQKYQRERGVLIWWLLLSVAVAIVGQGLMSVSKVLYDALFDAGLVCKLLSYVVPLLGFAAYTAGVLQARRRSEQRVDHLNAVLRGVRNVMQLIGRERDRQRLIDRVCRALTETRGFHGAWIGLFDDDGRFVTAAQAGVGEGFEALVERLERDDLPTCIRRTLAGQATYAPEAPTACAACALPAFCGGDAALSVRLAYRGATCGVLTIATDPDVLKDPEESVILQELAEDIALALNNLEMARARAAMEAALQEAVAELKRSNAELETFAYIASHDLQAPMNTVANYAALLADRAGDRLDAEAREYIGIMTASARRMMDLTDDLLSYARVGTRGAAFERVDLGVVLNDVLAALNAALTESGAAVARGDLPAVWGDPCQIAQLLQNLLANAIKFCEDTPRVHVGAERRDGMVHLSVRDNGIGIPADQLERIFVIFQRGRADDRPGTGIGLAICKRIAERHGGRIRVESTPGEGSTFTVSLPAPPDDR